MNLYTADLHFGHKNAILFDHRPFADVKQMDEALIYLWNQRVQKDDDVWIIGDFCYRSEKSPVNYLRVLRGRKHLIIGNHDSALLKNEQALSYFVSVDKMDHIRDGEHQIVMCHFPMAEWNKSRHGSLLIYGHIHSSRDETYEYMSKRYPQQAFNAGCMINGYAPVSLRELIENNKRFQENEL